MPKKKFSARRFLRSKTKPEYWLTRFVFLRLLGFVYFFAFLSLATQVVPLIGEKGLLPADNFLEGLGSQFEGKTDAFIALPSIFWIDVSDRFLVFFAWMGVLLSLIVLFGYANVPLLVVLWFLYMSFVHIGQLWYGYGWETQLLETGFLAIFFVPLLEWRPFPRLPPPVPIIWLLRWLAFRIHLGAGLIKIRGSSCWRDLTCLFYHFETQPIPNPLSPLFHFLPKIVNKFGVLMNHFVELIAPFFVFWPRIARHVAGGLMVLLQVILIFSGNLSFLNWLTILPVIACFDDGLLKRILPKKITEKAEKAAKKARPNKYHQSICWALVVVIALLSIPVINNLLSPHQVMNTSFNQLHLVNTYGAFGYIGQQRAELVVAGTSDEVITSETEWKEYEFKAKPTDVNRRLPIIAPYQPRIDWQIWFAAMSTPERYPWMIHFVWKLLHNDAGTISLIAENPFPDEPPKFVKVDLYLYKFASIREEAVWERQYVRPWISPLSDDIPELRQFIGANNWELYE